MKLEMKRENSWDEQGGGLVDSKSQVTILSIGSDEA